MINMTNQEIIEFVQRYGETREWSANTFKTYFMALNTLIKEHELLMMEKARLLADMENIEKQISTMQEKENNAYNSNQRTK